MSGKQRQRRLKAPGAEARASRVVRGQAQALARDDQLKGGARPFRVSAAPRLPRTQ